jgi:hypothetical protein
LGGHSFCVFPSCFVFLAWSNLEGEEGGAGGGGGRGVHLFFFSTIIVDKTGKQKSVRSRRRREIGGERGEREGERQEERGETEE